MLLLTNDDIDLIICQMLLNVSTDETAAVQTYAVLEVVQGQCICERVYVVIMLPCNHYGIL